MSAAACLTCIALMLCGLGVLAFITDRWPPADVSDVERAQARRRAMQRADGWGDDDG